MFYNKLNKLPSLALKYMYVQTKKSIKECELNKNKLSVHHDL